MVATRVPGRHATLLYHLTDHGEVAAHLFKGHQSERALAPVAVAILAVPAQDRRDVTLERRSRPVDGCVSDQARNETPLDRRRGETHRAVRHQVGQRLGEVLTTG
jgi:hypothetical protein